MIGRIGKNIEIELRIAENGQPVTDIADKDISLCILEGNEEIKSIKDYKDNGNGEITFVLTGEDTKELGKGEYDMVLCANNNEQSLDTLTIK